LFVDIYLFPDSGSLIVFDDYRFLLMPAINNVSIGQGEYVPVGTIFFAQGDNVCHNSGPMINIQD
jgi:hypothetical protein